MRKLLFEFSSASPKASRRVRPWFKIIFVLALLALLGVAFSQVPFHLNIYGQTLFVTQIKKLMQFANYNPNFPSETVATKTLAYLWITVKVTLTGTVLGFWIAMLTSFLSSRKITNNFFSWWLKLLMLFLRSFPSIIFINITKDVINDPKLVAVAIFAWFSWIWCHKYLLEIITNLDSSGYYWHVRRGHGRIQGFKTQILARCKNKFIMVFLYSLESNLRWTTLLATIGVIGIGFFINLNVPDYLEFVGLPLTILLGCIIVLEVLSIFVIKVLLNVKSQDRATFPWKPIAKWLLVIIAAIIALLTLVTLNFDKIHLEWLKSKLVSLANPRTALWSVNDPVINPWLAICQLFYQCLAAITIAACYALVMALLCSEKIQRFFVWLPAKLINNALRILPVVILFHIFNPVFVSSIGLGVILFGLHSGTIIAKQLSASINSLEEEIITFYKQKGYSQLMIIKIYVWPTIKKDFKAFAFIRLEVIFRNMILLGGLGFSIIGSKLDHFENRKQLDLAAAYIWPITITIFIYNLLPSLTVVARSKIIWKNSLGLLNHQFLWMKHGRSSFANRK